MPIPRLIKTDPPIDGSLYAARDLPKGHVLTAADIVLRTPRVEGAMDAALFDLAIGGVLLRDKAAEEPLYERHRGDSGDGIE